MLAAVGAGVATGVVGAEGLVAAWPFGDAPVQGGWSVDRLAAQPANPLMAALARAARAQRQPGALPPTVVRVFQSDRDGDDRLFGGASRYVVHFSRATVPSGSYWTIAALSDDGAPLDDGRSALAGNAPDIRRNGDGSLDILVQASPPDDPVANWLAAPGGRFRLILRLYAPLPDDGWRPPPVMRRESAA